MKTQCLLSKLRPVPYTSHHIFVIFVSNNNEMIAAKVPSVYAIARPFANIIGPLFKRC